MLVCGSGCQVVPSFNSFSTVIVLLALANKLILLETLSGNQNYCFICIDCCADNLHVMSSLTFSKNKKKIKHLKVKGT